MIGLVAGRVYWSANIGMAAARPFVSPSKATAIDTMFGGEHMKQFARGEIDLCDEDLPDVGFTWPKYILSWPGIIRNLIAHRPGRAVRFMVNLKARNEALVNFDIAAATKAELTRMLTESLQESLKDCDLLYFWWDCMAVGVLTKACRDWLGGREQGLGYRLQTAQGGFNWSLRRTQKLAHDRENWKSEAVRFLAGARRLFLELGQRLQEGGILADRGDIFFLELCEIGSGRWEPRTSHGSGT